MSAAFSRAAVRLVREAAVESASRPDRGFIVWRPTRRKREQVEQILGIIAEYHDILPLTLRQLFYILVARLAVAKTLKEYRALGYTLRRARRARMIPFSAIADDGSVLPNDLIGWQDETDLTWALRWQVENFDLWSEAAGMLRQLRRTADPYGVYVVTGGGFDSVTDKHKIAELVAEGGHPIEVLHIGDLDKSGEDIFTVLEEDAGAFADALGADILFTRIAITTAQVALYNLPTDPDHPNVVQAEALPPDILADIVETAIRDRLELNLVERMAAKTAAIRADYKAKLRAAGLWGAS